MTTVDFVYDTDCPNVATARGNLMRAFAKAGIAANWQEHRIGDPDAIARVRGFGSPTILVDGRDVAGCEPGAESCCRVYVEGNTSTGAPSVDAISAALLASAPVTTATPSVVPQRSSWLRTSLAVFPALGVALMPKLVCPLCWPAYAGVLSATGLTFLMEDTWLLATSTIALLLALAALAWNAKARRGYGPLLVGAASAFLILTGKFALDSSAALYGGVVVLIAASLWNAWPKRAVAPARPGVLTTTRLIH